MLKAFLADERGLETVEYAVMTGLIVTVVIIAIGALAESIAGKFDDTRGVIDGNAG